VVRVSAENLSLLVGLSGESLVESRWLRPFARSLQRLNRHQAEIAQALDVFRQSFGEHGLSEPAEAHLNAVSEKLNQCRGFLTDGLAQLDLFDRRATALSQRLNQAVLQTRMRPFADGIRRFPRMVRDLAHVLGKRIRLECAGELTQVDRDILEKLESPLAHLLRNAVDHGCESPDERRRAGKPVEGTVRLEAHHRAGLLLITVTDDGRGVDLCRVREVILQKKLTTPQVAEQMSELELLDFLFLPGFTIKDAVTEISGRGVGLDVVQNVVKSLRGVVRVASQPGHGMRFQLQLPLTLSVIRTLLVEVAGEAYAIPLPQIIRTVKLPRERIGVLEGRHHFKFDDQQVGLVTAHQVFDYGEPQPPENHLSVVVIGERMNRYGLVVDRFLGERELVVQPLDPRLGKVKDISAAALMEDGAPVLIVDVEDMIRSIEKLVARGQLNGVNTGGIPETSRKRVLAVDDSLTVRELERKLLTSRGYMADVAVDGMDGWNAVRTGHYDLVITDVDMPRLDGIELAMLIKRDPVLKTLPVMIVSYKDREEDRLRGLEAGADYYLAKGSFHDETLLQAVADLIGEPEM
jgi:two-component system, chemotaxis family, sensor histidine kinase and response regulator WspE